MRRRSTLALGATLAVTAAMVVAAPMIGAAGAAPMEYPTWSPTVNPTASDTPSRTPTWSPSPSPTADRGCTAEYRVVNSWFTGFVVEVMVTAGTSPISGWTVSWTFTNGEKMTTHFNGVFTSSGATQTVGNAPWNGALAAGAGKPFGFLADGTPKIPHVTCIAIP